MTHIRFLVIAFLCVWIVEGDDGKISNVKKVSVAAPECGKYQYKTPYDECQNCSVPCGLSESSGACKELCGDYLDYIHKKRKDEADKAAKEQLYLILEIVLPIVIGLILIIATFFGVRRFLRWRNEQSYGTPYEAIE